jgi:hypothetical protein
MQLSGQNAEYFTVKRFAMYRKMDTQIFQKSRNHLIFAGARRMAGRKFQTEEPQTLGHL